MFGKRIFKTHTSLHYIMSNLNEQAEDIIASHVRWSIGAGAIPIPVADYFAVNKVQTDMIVQLCTLYGINYEEVKGKAYITSLLGFGLAKLGLRAIKFIPGVGSVLGGVALGIISGAMTYAIGHVFKKHFEEGGTMVDFSPESYTKLYEDFKKKGTEYAEQLYETIKDKLDGDEEEPSKTPPKSKK